MKLTTVFAASAVVMGALSGASTAISAEVSPATPAMPTFTDAEHEVAPYWHSQNHIQVAPADDAACKIDLRRAHRLSKNECQEYEKGFKGLFITLEPLTYDLVQINTCVLYAYADRKCKIGTTIVRELGDADDGCHEVPNPSDFVFYSAKWACDEDTSDSVHARAVDADYHEKVVASPADNRNCNSAQNRDTDTKVHGHCHKFAKPFMSLSVTHKPGHKNQIGGRQPCYALVFTDEHCQDNGFKAVDLNNASALGVCHNLDDVDRPAGSTGIAGHSWKWLCGQENIDRCIKKPSHSRVKKVTPTTTSTSTVVSTVIVGCALTTSTGITTTVSSNIITETKVITHHHVVTNVQSITLPFSSTFSVCDVEVNTMLY